MEGENKMDKSKVTKFFNNTKAALSKRSPEILTGIGIAGMITTTVLAVKATPKAIFLIEEEKDKLEKDKLTVFETVKTVWKSYIPATVTGLLSIACIIGASSVSARRNAALATAYQVSRTALNEYKAKVIETIGEKKERTVRDEIAKDKIEKNPATKTEVIITDSGNSLCYDALSGRYFNSSIDHIKKVVNDLNFRMIGGEMYISLNEFYNEIGLPSIKRGDDIGWNISRSQIELDFSTQLSDDGRPCVVVDYMVDPREDFSSLM